MALVVKNPPASSGDVGNLGLILGWKDPLEEGMATHCSFLAWRILWTREPGGLQSMVTKSWTRLESTHTTPNNLKARLSHKFSKAIHESPCYRDLSQIYVVLWQEIQV